MPRASSEEPLTSSKGKSRYSDKLQNKKKQLQQQQQQQQHQQQQQQQQQKQQQQHHHAIPEAGGASGRSSRKPQKACSGGEGSAPPKKSQSSSVQHAAPKYDFPVKHILLTRDPKDRSVGGNGLGMRVIGGKEIPGTGGQLGAYVTRIYQGGVVESLGEIKEGDQVLEWNGVPLTGKTFEDVQTLVSQTEGEVEIVVKSVETSPPPKPPRCSIQSVDSHNSSSSPYDDVQALNCVNQFERKMSECKITTSSSMELEEPDAAGDYRAPCQLPNKGEVQLQVCYDQQAHILYVIVKRARNLRMYQGIPPDPLIKVYLLPGKVMVNQRRTRYFSKTCAPEWNATMVYENVSPEELSTRYLEVTAWNYDVYNRNHSLGGVLLNLADPSVVDEEARWYPLQDNPMLQASLNSHGSVSEKGRGSNNRVPIFPTATMSANAFSSHGCHGAICSIL